MTPVIERRQITPSDAAELLAKNRNNRSLSIPHAQRIARDISAGKWRFDGSPIRLLHDGTVGDGQHRLYACVLADKPIDALVISGFDAGALEAVDSGRKRRLSDRLTMRGVRRSRDVAAVLTGLFVLGHRNISATPSDAEAFAILERYPWLLDFVQHNAMPKGLAFLMRPTLIFGAVGRATGAISASDEWVATMKSGVPSRPDGCPAHALRERLIGIQARRQTAGGGHQARIFRLSCRAWSAMRDNRRLKVVVEPDALRVDDWSAADVAPLEHTTAPQ